MAQVQNFRELKCSECQNGKAFGCDFTMALQPVVDVASKTIFAQEALVRGIGNPPASEVFKHVTDANRYAFDQACRVKAIKLAAELNIRS